LAQSWNDCVLIRCRGPDDAGAHGIPGPED
jgi:hypothetical protein